MAEPGTAALTPPNESPEDTVAVIGAGGFIGSHLVHDLAAAGIRVTGWTRRHPALVAGALAPEVARSRTIVLVAGSINPAIAERDPAAAQAELGELTGLIEAIASVAALRETPTRVVLASSGGTVYDETTAPPYREDDPVAPTTAYGGLKLTMEQTLLRQAGSIEPVVLRLANVYGPGQRLGTGQGVIGHWFWAVASGSPLEVYGDPGMIRDYIYVRDVTAAVAAVHRAASSPAVLNIGSGVPTSLGELFDLVSEVVGRERVDLEVVPARGFDRRGVYLDVGQARSTLNWAPATSMRAGLEETWAAMRTAARDRVTPTRGATPGSTPAGRSPSSR